MLSAVTLFALAGCSGGTGGQATPIASNSDSPVPTSTAADAQLPGPGVPKVQDPIDTAKASQDPCTVLTAEQIKGFLGGPVAPKSENAGGGPSCSWFGGYQYEHASISVIVNGVDKRGLTSVYAAKGSLYKFFQPLPAVDGYPLVATDTAEKRTFGQCRASLGVRDDQTIELFVEQPDSRKEKKDPCDSVHAVAVAVVGNLKGGR
ncbi:DUF3558 domain-containing protein [Amycolatopsis sp. La24]|uniref:DUF3558 domain-containing protein n=1 Tax=Amycolatopsis sp. La24 TaxID=3028304 RepID=UPI0023AEA487|nr:DUF3558 domain-containing protein [Amycolatopsis sp. La24]